jgi:hypothetical protein
MEKLFFRSAQEIVCARHSPSKLDSALAYSNFPTNNTDFLDFYHADKTIRSFALQKSLYRLHGCHAAFYVFIICAKLLFFKITTKHFSNFCNKSKPSSTKICKG